MSATLRSRLRQDGSESVQVAQEDVWREPQPPSAKARRKLRPQRPEIDPMRALFEFAQREPVGTEPEEQIEQPPLAQHAGRAQRRAERPPRPASPMPPHSQRQIEQDPEVAAHPGRRRPDRLRVARGIAHRERIEREIVVVALEPEAGGQDEIRVPRGLVAVEIDRDHVLEPGKGPVQARAVGRGEHRVAGERDQGPDAALSFRVDFLGERRGRQLASKLGQASHPAAPAIEVATIARPRRERDEICRRRGEHEATFAIQVPRDGIERDDQPG